MLTDMLDAPVAELPVGNKVDIAENFIYARTLQTFSWI